MDITPTDFDGSPPWVRLGWAGMRALIANSEARDIVSEAPMLAMARALFMAITPHLAGDADSADVSVTALIAAGVGDLTMFHWLTTNLPHGFCRIAVVDKKGARLVGDAALDCLERHGPGLTPFYQVDLRQLRLLDESREPRPSTAAATSAPAAAA